VSAGLPGVCAAIAAGEDLPAGTPTVYAADGAERTAVGDRRPRPCPAVLANGFTLSLARRDLLPRPSLKDPPRILWHASPDSSGNQ